MDLSSSCAIPTGWRCRDALDQGVLMSAVAPDHSGAGLAPTIRLEVEPVHLTATAWVAEELADLSSRLAGLVVEHEDSSDLSGVETCYRRLRHLRLGIPAVTEQWGWLIEGLGFTLTASAPATEHEHYASLFAAVADSFAVGAQPSSSVAVRAARSERSATA